MPTVLSPPLAFVVLAGCGRVAFDPEARDAAISVGDVADGAADAAPSNVVLDFALDSVPWHDSAPGQHDATCTTCPTAVTDATRGTVGMFNGSECLRIADAPELRPTQFTVTVWAAWANGISEIFSRPLNGQDVVSNTYELYADSTSMTFYVNSTSRVGPAPVANVWHHVAGVYDGNEALLYIDGAAVSGPVIAGPLTYANDSIFIGCDLDVGTEVQGFIGKLDAVRLYGVALAPSEIVADMNR